MTLPPAEATLLDRPEAFFMNVRRLAFVFVALPLAFYAYACSSDPEATPEPDNEGGTGDFDSGTDPGRDTGTPDEDGSTETDGGDGGPTACVGNPLQASGGGGDGGGGGGGDAGLTLDAAVSQRIVTANGAFLDGPQWVEIPGG